MLSAFCIVRKNDFLNFGKNRIEMEYGMEDYDGWLGLCENGYLGVSIPEKLVKYRVRKDSMSRQFNFEMRLHLSNQMSKSHKNIYNVYGMEIYNLFMANGPGYFWNNPTFELPPVNIGHNNVESESTNIVNNSKIIKIAFKLKLNKLVK